MNEGNQLVRGPVRVDGRPPRVVLLLVDGLRPDVAESELRAGHLPHLARLIRSGGVGRAITAFPATTSVSYLPFLTGCLPGRCNVPSIRWMDRTAYTGRWWKDRAAVRSYCGYQAGLLDGDIDPGIRTLFELVPESAAFFTMITRGLSPERDPAQGARKFWGAVSHYLLWHQPGDDVVARGLLRWIDRDPAWRFLFAQFPAVDGYTHQSHPGHPKVLAALHQVDVAVGALVESLTRRGLLDDTLLLMVSDHGASRVRRHLDLAQWFRDQGVPTLSHPELWRRDPRAAVMVAGNGSAMVYAAPGRPRPERWPVDRLRRPEAFGAGRDLVAGLAAEPGVAFVAGATTDGGVAVIGADGHATLREAAGVIHHEPGTGDPLGLGPARAADHRTWLERTFDGPYPDGPRQLLDQFRSPRTGDLVVVAREGFDFRDRWEIPEHRSGHGSLIRAHMQTPLWSNRPLGETPLRTVDLFATMLDWLGERLPEGVDAELVWNARTGTGSPRPVGV